MKETELEKKRRIALSAKQKKRPLDTIHPSFVPRWKTTPTKPIRVPEEYAEILLEIARRLDNQTLSVDHVREAIAAKTEQIKAEVLKGLKDLS